MLYFHHGIYNEDSMLRRTPVHIPIPPTKINMRYRLFSNASRHEHQHLHDLLGTKPGANQAELKKAYYRMAKKHHPDIQGGNHRKFQDMHDAYRVLSGTETYKHQHQYQQQERRSHSYQQEREEVLDNLMRQAVWSGLRLPLTLFAFAILVMFISEYLEEKEKIREQHRKEKEQEEHELETQCLLEEERKYREEHPEAQREFERAARCHGNGIALMRTCF